MGGKNKHKNKNKQNDKKQSHQQSTQSKTNDNLVPEVETKVQPEKTQTVLQPQTKVEEVSNNIKTEQSNTVSQDLKAHSSNNIEPTIDSNLGQSNYQVQKLEARQQKSQSGKSQEQVIIPLQQTQNIVRQPQAKEDKHQLQVQHNTQPLQVVEERSLENLTQQVASQGVDYTLPENSTGDVAQSRIEEHLPEISNIVYSDNNHVQVTENLPVQSDIKENQVQNEVQKVAQAFNQANEAEAESLPQRKLDVVAEIQHKGVSERNLESILNKQDEKPLEVPQELNNTESFASIEGEQQRQRQCRQAFFNCNQTIIQKSSKKGPSYTDNKVETERVETESVETNSIFNQVVNQNRTQVQENKEIAIKQQQGSSQVILEHSTDNIQILQHSAPFQIQVERPPVHEQQILTETICLTESVNVQTLVQTQQRPHQTQIQAPKVEVRPEVVEVQVDSNVVLDINQPIQLVQGAHQVQREPNSQQQKQTQKVQTKQEIPSQQVVQQKVAVQRVLVQQEIAVQRAVRQEVIVERVEPAENKIFTLVQSQEIPIEQGDKEINIQVSTQIPQTQINVNKSLSFSDLNFSVERSAGKESISGNHQNQEKQKKKESLQQTENKLPNQPQTQNKLVTQSQAENEVIIQQQTKQKVPAQLQAENQVIQLLAEKKVAEARPQTLPQEVIGEVIQPIKTIESNLNNLSQPIKMFEQSISRSIQVLVQEKVAVTLAPQVLEVRNEPQSEVVSILVEKTSETVINTDRIEILKQRGSNNEQRQCDSNVQQRQELSTSNKQAIVQEARIKQEIKEHIQQQVKVNDVQNADTGEHREQEKQQLNKNPSSLIQKFVIPASVILGGGIAWGLTKSAHKSIIFGAVGLTAALLTTRLLK